MKNKYALVIMSHSSYVDVWPTTIDSYKKYLRSDDFDCFLAVDGAENYNELLNESGFNLVRYSNSISWSAALQEVLSKLDYEKIIFSYDDLILSREVDVNRLIKLLNQNKSDYLKLVCSNVKVWDRLKFWKEDFEISKYDSYRGTLVFAAISKRMSDFIECNSNLIDLSPWEFEMRINDVLPSDYSYRAVLKNIIHFRNLVIKGKINYVDYTRLQIFSELTYKGTRSFMGFRESFVYLLKLSVFSTVKYFLPSYVFAKLRHIKKKLII